MGRSEAGVVAEGTRRDTYGGRSVTLRRTERHGPAPGGHHEPGRRREPVPGAPATAGTEDLTAATVEAQRGSEAAFELLYVAVQPRLLRYLRALVGEDAEDVASEAWLQISRDLPRLRDVAGFRGWAATIARNRALDHLRRQRRRPVVTVPVEELVELPTSQPDSCEGAVTSISTDAAIVLIASLPRDQAEAVLLRVVVGLDAESAARVLGKRAGAVRIAAHRGLRRLAARVERPPEFSGRGGVTPDRPSAPEQTR